ncbi:MAG TPA: DUF488 family protein [Polyangia bacterium]
MPIRTRRWNDPPEPGDGFRLLVCRLRPRGVPAKTQPWDDWWPDLGPSRRLLDEFHGKAAPSRLEPRRSPARRASPGEPSPEAEPSGGPLPWSSYVARYLDEMRGGAQVWRIRALAQRVAAGETVTLLCSSACTDPARCHRTLLARLIAPEAAA